MITKHLIFATLLAGLLVGGFASADVYLSTAGADANDGLTAGTPKLTLGAALGVLNGQTAPTTLHIAAGTYTQNGIFNVTVSGSAGNLVTIQGEGGTVTLRQSVLNVQGAFVTIQNISFDAQDLHEACVVVRSTAADCTISSCNFTGVKEVGEHFNTETSEAVEDIDVAPVQVMAANRCTIQNCNFNGTALQLWDYAILMPSATGGAQDLTVTGCTIEGATSCTGGVKILRQCFNVQILNTNFANIMTEAFSLESNGSAIASGTSVGILIQGGVSNGGYRADSQRGLMELYRCQADNVQFRNLIMYSVGSGGADGIKISSATCTNVTIDGFNYAQNLGGGTRAISITNHDGNSNEDGLAAVCYVGNILIQNAVINTGPSGTAIQLWNYPVVDGITLRNIVVTRPGNGNFLDWYSNSTASNILIDGLTATNGSDTIAWYATSHFRNATIRNFTHTGTSSEPIVFESGSTFANILIEDCTFTRLDGEVGPGGNAISMAGGVQVNGCTMRRLNVNWLDGNDALAFWGATSSFQNFTLQNSYINSTRDAFVVADTPMTGIVIEDCTMTASAHGVVARRDNGAFVNVTMRRCRFHIGQLDPDIAIDTTWGAAICARIGTARWIGGVIEDILCTGHRALGFYDVGVKENLIIRRVISNTDYEAVLTGVGNVLRNTTFQDCNFVSNLGYAGRFWQNLTTFGPCIFENITMTNCIWQSLALHGMDLNQQTTWTGLNASNCLFEGRGSSLGSGSLGIKVEVGSTITSATFNNCVFKYAGPIDDVTDFRMGGFLLEDPGTALTSAGFHNCLFDGGNAGFIAQRFRISDGASIQPTVTSVLLDNCSFVNQKDRAVSLHYSQGSNVIIKDCTVSGGLRGHAVYALWHGNRLSVQNLTVDGGGVQRGVFFGTSANTEFNNWSILGGAMTNLANVGIRLAAGVRDSAISGVTLAGAAGSSHGIFVDNSGASGAGAKFATNINISNTSVSGFGGDGIRLHGSSHTVSGCTVAGVGGVGINILDDSQVRPVPANVQCTNNTVSDCAGAGVRLEGQDCTVSGNRILRCGEGIQVRSGLSGVLAGESNTTGNMISRNAVRGGVPASLMGISEALNPGFSGDPGPNSNAYVNNTVTDWAQGTEFRGFGNRIWNNIFYFNTPGTDFRVLPSGLGGLRAGWNCAGRQTDTRFDGIYVDFTKDIWYDPSLVSRDPVSPNFYYLTAGTSPCLDRGTTNGLVPDGTTDLGCIETGTSEVASWRLY